jgi:cytochrome c-type biogenesis protein CcmH/NrfF
MSARGRGALATVVVLVAVLAASLAVATAGSAPRPMSARVDEVAQGLRCPTCDAESVAASNTPIAQGMRVEIRDQLKRGRKPDQIRAWFRQRYGDQVLLMPSAHGMNALLWVVPLAALLAGGAAWVAVQRRRSTRRTGAHPAVAAMTGRRVAVATAALVVAGAAVPVAVWARSTGPDTEQVSAETAPSRASGQRNWTAVAVSLEEQKDYAGAVRAYRKALQQQPGSAAIRTRLGFNLLRSGRPAGAEPVVRGIAAKKGPYRPLALLVLGLAQRQQGDPAGAHTLRRFLEIAPDHPAADQVRRLLKGQS